MSKFLNPSLAKLAPYTPGEQPQDQVYIKLNTNESPFPPSPRVIKAVEAEAGRLQLYPDPAAAALRNTMATHFGVKPENTFASNGSDEVLAFVFQGLCPNGVAFPDISYGFYPVYAQLYSLDVREVPLREDFSIAPADYANMGRTIVIANPNAPSGLALSLAQIEEILQANAEQLVVIDEAYVDFGAESAVPLTQKYDNLLVVGTFSKSRSMAGARLGYAVGNQALIEDLERIKFSFNPYNINRMTMAAGKAALEDVDYFEQCRRRVMQVRAQTMKKLKELGFTCTDSKTNFIFASHAEVPAETLYQKLRENGVLVRWWSIPRIKNYLRITVGSSEQMKTMLERLQVILQDEAENKEA